jgi:hypothetical protein
MLEGAIFGLMAIEAMILQHYGAPVQYIRIFIVYCCAYGMVMIMEANKGKNYAKHN